MIKRRPYVDDFVRTHKDQLKVAQGSGFRSLRRNDGGNVPHPSTNIMGNQDCYVAGKGNVMLAMSPANYGRAVFELMQWALANYPVGEETELPKQSGLGPVANISKENTIEEA